MEGNDFMFRTQEKINNQSNDVYSPAYAGPNVRIAPFGNRTGHPTGKYPHYHRRGFKPNGKVKPGQGIGRHRPGDTKPEDKSFFDRF